LRVGIEASAAERLVEIANRVQRLGPNHRDPELFHAEKSEIVHELRHLSRLPILTYLPPAPAVITTFTPDVATIATPPAARLSLAALLTSLGELGYRPGCKCRSRRRTPPDHHQQLELFESQKG
jgi:hypothetical protein